MSLEIHTITSIHDDRIDEYRNVRDADLAGRRNRFIAEGRFIVRTLLDHASRRTRSLLVTQPALDSLAAQLQAMGDPPPVYLATQTLMNEIVGFDIHRGCLAVGERPEPTTPVELLSRTRRDADMPQIVPVLEHLNNHDNVGAIFRSALAFGAIGVILSDRCCDPLYRKAIRVSMGASIRLPWARAMHWPDDLESLRRQSWKLAALVTDPDADDLSCLGRTIPCPDRLLLLIGEEGPGLSDSVRHMADLQLRITMSPGLDSLNAATAGAIAMHWVSCAHRDRGKYAGANARD